MERAVGLSYIDMIESAYSMSVSPGRMLNKAVLLSRPALARRDAPFPNKAAACEEANRTLCRTLSL